MLNKHFWVVGAGGIGLAITDKLIENDAQITLLSQKTISHPTASVQHINYSVENEVKTFVEQNALPDGVIIATGILHKANNLPEKSITQVTPEWLQSNILANTMPTLLLTKYITPKLKRSSKLDVIALSARVGSISDNKLGGWHSYRMSKAMLNMLIKNIAIEWRFKAPTSCIIAYHPGTVDTPLSQPFQQNIPKEKLFSRKQAGQYLYNVIANLNKEQSGNLIDWKGDIISP